MVKDLILYNFANHEQSKTELLNMVLTWNNIY